jgi:hypothetical protein
MVLICRYTMSVRRRSVKLTGDTAALKSLIKNNGYLLDVGRHFCLRPLSIRSD